MRVYNQTRKAVLISRARMANSFWSRLRGLLGTTSLKAGEGLILAGEKSIHTLFMKFPIDVVYINKQHIVVRTTTNMVPYRLGPFVSQSAYVLEMPVGTIEQTSTQVGDHLSLES